MIKKFFLKIIKAYQYYFSPFLGHSCRFYPSCSEYMSQSVEKWGVSRGINRGIRRLIKCHPFNPGGIDLP